MNIDDRVIGVRADNPGPMTLEGTNTWVLGTGGELVVIDPGPLLEDHLHRVAQVVADRGERVGLTLVTHWHDDHAGAAGRWAELTGAAVRGGSHGEALGEGEEFTVGGLRARVLLTPGHTRDSVSVLLPDDGVLFSGDTVLGRGTSVVAHPDGDVGQYLNSLERLREVVAEHDVRVIAPGHGPVIHDPAGVLEFYLSHRRERLEQVRAALAGGAAQAADPVEAVVQQVYAEVPPQVWPAARLTVQAQMAYLRETAERDRL